MILVYSCTLDQAKEGVGDQRNGVSTYVSKTNRKRSRIHSNNNNTRDSNTTRVPWQQSNYRFRSNVEILKSCYLLPLTSLIWTHRRDNPFQKLSADQSTSTTHDQTPNRLTTQSP
ncbi:hypothetical protein O0I10_010872 [Lichtheimia ornata]|uniref:Uncharacterized protein n=1 Tax=Lichtheimia ornata TaxID=688661 RepID=A0AAD7XUL7_9FUNG|nr:uncharacterized protein O0I10_010872 [Lichtheimia ornata]KAJ8653436.1 hypothetical protein O0I10_010872 [Lichtheimia ornata]